VNAGPLAEKLPFGSSQMAGNSRLIIGWPAKTSSQNRECEATGGCLREGQSSSTGEVSDGGGRFVRIDPTHGGRGGSIGSP